MNYKILHHIVAVMLLVDLIPSLSAFPMMEEAEKNPSSPKDTSHVFSRERKSRSEEEGRRRTETGEEDVWAALDRGKDIAAREDFDFSLEKIDGTFAPIEQALRECKERLDRISIESLDKGSLTQESLHAEQEMQYWAKQNNNIASLLSRRLTRQEASSIEGEQKLSKILALCREIWMQWDEFFSKIQDEIEKRNGTLSDEKEDDDLDSVSELGKPMASLKITDASGSGKATVMGTDSGEGFAAGGVAVTNVLKNRLETFLATPHLVSSLRDSHLHITQSHQQKIRNKIQELLQRYSDEVTLNNKFVEMLKKEGEKFRKEIKKSLEDVAKEHYSKADQLRAEAKMGKALDGYRLAILVTDEAIFIWSETEIFYTKLRDAVGGKVRRLGIRIKATLRQDVRKYQEKVDKIELNRKESIDRIIKKLNPLQAQQQIILEQAAAIDRIEKNEIGTLCRVVSGNLVTMISHLNTAQNAYSKYDVRGGEESEKKGDRIKQEVERLNSELQRRLALWQEWQEKNREPQCIETDSNQGSIWKMSFMGPLVRREKIPASATELEHEVEMAAEHLMIVLRPEQTEEGFKNDLATRGYSQCRLEKVSKEDSLYRLYFQPNQNVPHPWLQTMDELKKTIQENQLAIRCYPDYMMEIDSSSIAAIPNGILTPPVQQEPWAFHHDKGLHPPVSLFDPQQPLLKPPQSPIRIGIIDTGIFGSIQNGRFETHTALDGKIICNADENGVIVFGYNACDPYTPNAPEDTHGHGTHVAGIIAAKHGIIDSVAGLAGMSNFVQLIVCKWVQPKSNKGLCSDAIKCIKYAEQQGAQIINCSWGRRLLGVKNPTGFTPEEILDLEMSIRDKKFIVVASAGNNLSGGGIGEDVDSINRYPCNFVLPNLISVAGTGKEGKVPNNFSNFGKGSIHLAAPGKDIVSTWIGAPNAIMPKTGSSQAAPYVAAALALAKIKYPLLAFIQLANHLCTACGGASGDEMKVKYGPLNLEKILSNDQLIKFLKTQKMTGEEIEQFLNPKKGKKKMIISF